MAIFVSIMNSSNIPRVSAKASEELSCGRLRNTVQVVGGLDRQTRRRNSSPDRRSRAVARPGRNRAGTYCLVEHNDVHRFTSHRARHRVAGEAPFAQRLAFGRIQEGHSPRGLLVSFAAIDPRSAFTVTRPACRADFVGWIGRLEAGISGSILARHHRAVWSALSAAFRL